MMISEVLISGVQSLAPRKATETGWGGPFFPHSSGRALCRNCLEPLRLVFPPGPLLLCCWSRYRVCCWVAILFVVGVAIVFVVVVGIVLFVGVAIVFVVGVAIVFVVGVAIVFFVGVAAV